MKSLILASIIALSLIGIVEILDSFAESPTRVKITTERHQYHIDEKISIEVKNTDKKPAIFNVLITDPDGNLFDDECVDYDRNKKYLLPDSSVIFSWDTFACKDVLKIGKWNIASKLSVGDILTDMTYSKEVILFDVRDSSDKYWKTQQVVEKNLYDQTKKDQVFLFPYRVTNDNLESIDFDGGFRINLGTETYNEFEIKIPRNYPFTNISDPRDLSLLLDGKESAYDLTVSDCFYHYKFSLTNNVEIELAATFTLDSAPFVGEDIPKHCTAKTILSSPKYQMDHGISATEIICKDNLVLLYKNHQYPACVKPESVSKLFQRGWATSYYDLDQVNEVDGHTIKYSIEGDAEITGIIADHRPFMVIVHLNPVTSGILTIELPPEIIENKRCKYLDGICYLEDERLIVLLGGMEIAPEEIKTTSGKRTLVIPFQEDSRTIEIIGDFQT